MLALETARLLVRRFEDADVPDILDYSCRADAQLARILDWEPNEASIRACLEPQKDVDPFSDPQWMTLVVELKELGQVIGVVGWGVTRVGRHKQGMVGWAFDCAFQGQGYATEAARALIDNGFAQLGLHRISVRTGADNVPSWHLMERLGMRREAHFIQSHVIDDQWRDEYVYAVLAAEWEHTPSFNADPAGRD